MSDNADKLNNLLLALKPEINELKQLVKTFKTIDSPYKDGFNFLVSLAKFQTQLVTKTNIEEDVKGIISQIEQFTKLMDRIVVDDEARDLYEQAGNFDALNKHREKILKIIEQH